MNHLLKLFLFCALAGMLPGATVSWTEWKTKSANSMTGTITLPDATTVDVTFSGDHFFAENISSLAGQNGILWSSGPDSTYESATAENRPPDFGWVAIGRDAVPVTLTFSRPIVDPVMSWASINGFGVQFNTTVQVLSSGCGFWGCSTLQVIPTNLLRPAGDGNGEGHGTIILPGTFSSLTFNSEGPEGYRAFTIGILGVSEPTAGEIPEPSAALLLGGGLVALAAWRRKTRIAQ